MNKRTNVSCGEREFSMRFIETHKGLYACYSFDIEVLEILHEMIFKKFIQRLPSLQITPEPLRLQEKSTARVIFGTKGPIHITLAR